MTRRLLLSYLALAVAILVVLEVPLAVLGARHERDLATSQGQKIATGLAIAAGEDFENQRQADLSALALHYRQATGGEVAIADSTGHQIVSSDADHDNDTEGAAAPLVRTALGGGLASAIISDEGEGYVVAAAPIGGPGGRTGAVLLSLSAQAATNRVHLLWAALAGFALFFLLVALVVGRLMTSALSRPLERLGRAVSALDESNLEARAHEDDGPAEVQALALQFNQMANRLTELVKAQGRFVADASHQLRSPLTALRLRIENLEAQVPAADGRAVAAIGDEVQRLSRLVDGLITLGHADAVSPERSTVDVDHVIEERCRAWAALAQERRIALDPPLPGDERRSAQLVEGDLDQILDNLLANALDVSPPDTTITVRLDNLRERGFEIHITDEGPGMTDEQLGRAFDRFWQGSSSAGSHGGLGLAIVRQLSIRNGLHVRLAAVPHGGLDAVIGVQQSRRRRRGRQPVAT
ncbi:MAG: HAMP domain-containing histidine kinase [Actinomycetota bacterium]|nr:HAMP domain-containing histidine kinase [Actinomycetota bacterium]